MNSQDYMDELVSGLAEVPPFEELEPTVLPLETSGLDGILWVSLGVALIGLGWMLAKHIVNARKWSQWRSLKMFFESNSSLEMAQVEFRTLEILIGVFDNTARANNADWMLLTHSEIEVALATLQDKTVGQIAADLSCTKSHVYNIRAAIRKKWGLESSELLKAAVEERYQAYIN